MAKERNSGRLINYAAKHKRSSHLVINQARHLYQMSEFGRAHYNILCQKIREGHSNHMRDTFSTPFGRIEVHRVWVDHTTVILCAYATSTGHVVLLYPLRLKP